ncbi:unnamed protein product, partial [marine sediment metagenome]
MIKMRIKTSVNPRGQIYIPKKIREAIGMKVGEINEITLIGDASTLFIIPIDFDAYDALKSL